MVVRRVLERPEVAKFSEQLEQVRLRESLLEQVALCWDVHLQTHVPLQREALRQRHGAPELTRRHRLLQTPELELADRAAPVRLLLLPRRLQRPHLPDEGPPPLRLP